MINKNKSIDLLIKGIKQIILKDRCSFSVEERILLNDCIKSLQEFKKVNIRDPIPKLDLILKVIDILNKLFLTGNYFKDLF